MGGGGNEGRENEGRGEGGMRGGGEGIEKGGNSVRTHWLTSM
jgi:hypothetical protein